ncbi:MAG: hypothetical protein HYR66_01225 [Sphingobacteriales bacterium]|nr:hypothetical protein [Sphingobacteriales bacterium]MBI3718750.1 hypothetical protein [Sphingobacteriales bacterium]
MSKEIKSKIYKLVEGIKDETVLNQLMEDAAFYATKKDVVDELNPAQLAELDKAIEEADKNQTISWDNFKKEINEWPQK